MWGGEVTALLYRVWAQESEIWSSLAALPNKSFFLYPYFLIDKMGTVPSTLTTSKESNVVARIQTDDQCENTFCCIFKISFEI